MKPKLFLVSLFGVFVAVSVLGGCAKKDATSQMAKDQMPLSESHPALSIVQNQHVFVYSDSAVSTIQPVFLPSPNNGLAWVQVMAGPPTTITLQAVKSAFSSAFPQGQVRVMYATAPVSSGGDPYDTSWQLALNTPTAIPPSCRDVVVAQYQTTPGGTWTPFDCVTVMDTSYNPMPSLEQNWITTPGEYYFNFKTKDETTAVATCTISVP